jgi:hypothetical protein
MPRSGFATTVAPYAAQPSFRDNSSTASGGLSLKVNTSPIPCTGVAAFGRVGLS